MDIFGKSEFSQAKRLATKISTKLLSKKEDALKVSFQVSALLSSSEKSALVRDLVDFGSFINTGALKLKEDLPGPEEIFTLQLSKEVPFYKAFMDLLKEEIPRHFSEAEWEELRLKFKSRDLFKILRRVEKKSDFEKKFDPFPHTTIGGKLGNVHLFEKFLNSLKQTSMLKDEISPTYRGKRGGPYERIEFSFGYVLPEEGFEIHLKAAPSDKGRKHRDALLATLLHLKAKEKHLSDSDRVYLVSRAKSSSIPTKSLLKLGYIFTLKDSYGFSKLKKDLKLAGIKTEKKAVITHLAEFQEDSPGFDVDQHVKVTVKKGVRAGALRLLEDHALVAIRSKGIWRKVRVEFNKGEEPFKLEKVQAFDYGWGILVKELGWTVFFDPDEIKAHSILEEGLSSLLNFQHENKEELSTTVNQVKERKTSDPFQPNTFLKFISEVDVERVGGGRAIIPLGASGKVISKEMSSPYRAIVDIYEKYGGKERVLVPYSTKLFEILYPGEPSTPLSQVKSPLLAKRDFLEKLK